MADRGLRRTADLIKSIQTSADGGVWGHLATVISHTATELTVDLDGAGVAIPVRFPTWYTPVDGDTVYCLRQGHDVFMVAKFA